MKVNLDGNFLFPAANDIQSLDTESVSGGYNDRSRSFYKHTNHR